MQTILIPQPGPGDVLIQVPISTTHLRGELKRCQVGFFCCQVP